MADEVLDRLIERQIVVVHGDSGCGKSSLVRAAILPRLKQENARGGIRWRTCIARPGASPVWNVAHALAALEGGSEQEVAEHALELRRLLNFGRDAPAALAERLRSGDGGEVCLLIDQFEELFEHAKRRGPADANLLTEVLTSLCEKPPPGFHAVLTMRSEYLGATARFRGLAETVNQTQYLLPAMTYEDLCRAIREPALLYGGTVTQELTDKLIDDKSGGTDKLPVIQHGLMLLHRYKVLEGDVAVHEWSLGIEDFPAVGGLAGLLSGHADRVASEAKSRAGLAGDSRVVEDLFRALIDTNAERKAIRRPQELAKLVDITGASEDALRTIIDVFGADGVSFLLTYRDSQDDREFVDISHEALIRCWQAISKDKGWLDAEFNNGLLWKSLLVQADSFDANPANVLSPATTQERALWLERRNPTWAERYGGQWDRVRTLLDRSAQTAAASARKTRRLKLAIGFLAAAGVMVAVAFTAMVANTNRELEELVTTLELNDQRAAQRESQIAELNSTLRAKDESIQGLIAAAQANSSTAEQALRRLESSQNPSNQAAASAARALLTSVSAVAARLDEATASTPPPPATQQPRVYLQIADESQRPIVREFQSRLAALEIDGARINVPGIELVKVSPPRTVIRCFRVEECTQDGVRLVALVNELLRSPQAMLEDLSGRYTSSTSIRDRHYEIWFAARDEIALQPPRSRVDPSR
jgi:hypothetical protein